MYYKAGLHSISYLSLFVLMLIVQFSTSCNRIDNKPPAGSFTFGDSIYSIQQLINGEAAELNEVGLIKRVESISIIGIEPSMLQPDGIEKVWGKPEYTSTDGKEVSELSGVYEYFLGTRPTSYNPIELVEIPHVLAFFHKGKVKNISAKLGVDTQNTDRFILGKLRLLDSSREQYESILGKPMSVPLENSAKSAVILRWNYLAGKRPTRMLVLIQATFEKSISKRASVDFGYEVASTGNER